MKGISIIFAIEPPPDEETQDEIVGDFLDSGKELTIEGWGDFKKVAKRHVEIVEKIKVKKI